MPILEVKSVCSNGWWLMEFADKKRFIGITKKGYVYEKHEKRNKEKYNYFSVIF